MKPSSARLLTYADYAAMPDDGKRYELIDGTLFEMSAPTISHQAVIAFFITQLSNALAGQRNMVVGSPCDVRLPKSNETPEGATTVVQPDVLVISTDSRNEACQTGAPVFVVEVLSPSSLSHDQVRKLKIYGDCGVSEYWIINIRKLTVQIYRKGTNGFDPVERCDFTKPQPVSALCGLVMNLPLLLLMFEPNAAPMALEISEAKVQEAVRAMRNLSLEEQSRVRKLLGEGV